MVKVKFLQALFAEQTNTHYTQGAEVRIPNDLAERHGPEGTGIVEFIEDDGSPDPVVEAIPPRIEKPKAARKAANK